MYKKKYNSIIEHFSDNKLLDEITARNFLIYKQDSSSNMYNNHYENVKEAIDDMPNQNRYGSSSPILDIGESQNIGVLAVLVGMTNVNYNNGYNIIQNADNVSENIKTKYRELNEQRKQQIDNPNYVLAYNSLKDVISQYMGYQDKIWKNIYSSSDPEFDIKLNDHVIEQNALSEEYILNNDYKNKVNEYDKYSKDMYNMHRMKSRNQYINEVQSNIIKNDMVKDKMLTSDIMTKEREIQLTRYAYLQKKRINDGLKLTIFFFILIIIFISIGLIATNIPKIVIGIISGLFAFIWLILIIGKMHRNNLRYKLDFDERDFGDMGANKSCSKKTSSFFKSIASAAESAVKKVSGESEEQNALPTNL